MSSCSEHGDQAQSTAHDSHPRYGVRSYLHHFYEECTASIWAQEEDFHIQRSPSSWSIVLWKVCLIFGTLILFVGLTVLIVGYAAPPKIEAFGVEGLLFVDNRAVHFNRALDICKLVGGVLFCAGGSLAAAGLLLAEFAQRDTKEERRLQQRFKEKLAELQAAIHPVTRGPTQAERSIPVTLSKVHKVQPASRT